MHVSSCAGSFPRRRRRRSPTVAVMARPSSQASTRASSRVQRARSTPFRAGRSTASSSPSPTRPTVRTRRRKRRQRASPCSSSASPWSTTSSASASTPSQPSSSWTAAAWTTASPTSSPPCPPGSTSSSASRADGQAASAPSSCALWIVFAVLALFKSPAIIWLLVYGTACVAPRIFVWQLVPLVVRRANLGCPASLRLRGARHLWHRPRLCL